MKTKKFDNLGIEPSLLGFGCMRFPLDEDGKINEKEAEKMIDKAIGSGVTYIDTAFPYHNGDSEPFVGKVLKKYKREDFFLATKLPIWNVSSKEEAKKVFEKGKSVILDLVSMMNIRFLKKFLNIMIGIFVNYN